MRILKILLILLLSGYVQSEEFSDSKENYSGVIMNFEKCETDKLGILKVDVYRYADGKEPKAAWNLTRRALCGRSSGDIRYVMSHMSPNATVSTVNEFGEEELTVFRESDERLRLFGVSEGGVYIYKNDDGINVSIDAGICGYGLRMIYVGNDWNISNFGGGCD